MREIKFRGWNKIKNQMQTVLNIGYFEGRELNVSTDSEEGQIDYYNNEIELMQYTGLKDKNDVEIYEGDIVRVKWREENIGQVIYEYNGFTIDVMNMNRPYGRVDLLNNFTEVIGNIYENPELLEVK